MDCTKVIFRMKEFEEETNLNTYMAKAQDIERKWYVVDASGMVLGRLASQVANILRGKNKPIYTPHVDTGDHVIIVNASKVVLTGKKLEQKMYYHHSGYTGGLKEVKYRTLMNEKPEFAVRKTPSWACCPRVLWAVRWRPNCVCMPALNMSMPRSSPKSSN